MVQGPPVLTFSRRKASLPRHGPSLTPPVQEPEPHGTREGEHGQHQSGFARLIGHEVKGEAGESCNSRESQDQESEGAPREATVTHPGGQEDKHENPEENPFERDPASRARSHPPRSTGASVGNAPKNG